MISQRTQTAKPGQIGFTLLELLIAIVLALIILSGVISVFVNTVVGSKTTLELTRMEQDLNSAILVMSEDLRRATYWGTPGYDAADLTINPYYNIFVSSTASPSGDPCIRYTYNLNDDSTIQDDEMFGFRLSSGAIWMYDYQGTSAVWNSCTSGDWEELTDLSYMTVNKFDISTPVETFVVSDASASLYSVEIVLDITASLNSGNGSKDAEVSVVLGNVVAK